MEETLLAGLGSAVGFVLVAIVGLVGWRVTGRSNGNGVSPEYARIAAENGTKIDAQHDTLQNILAEQRETTKAVVEVATILKQNGRSH